jgi:hypothetical protein
MMATGKRHDSVPGMYAMHRSTQVMGYTLDYIDTCSPSDYGRTVYTHPKDNIRLYPPVARGSQDWKDTYKHRTSSERVFKREKEDFKLSSFRTRCKERLLFYGLLTAIAVHVDTWFRQDNESNKAA